MSSKRGWRENENMDSEEGVAGVMTCRVIKTVTEDVAERWMDTTTRYQRRGSRSRGF
jgi:hypothetical protein